MLIDTHCHVNFAGFKDDADKVIQDSLDHKTWLITVGSQLSTSRRAVEIAKEYNEGVYAIVGLHPIHLFAMEVDEEEEGIEFKSRAEEFDYELYKELAAHPKVVGIGEMGIDYFHLPSGEELAAVKAKQRRVFLQGLKLAQELGKPITIHTRPQAETYDAYDDEIEIIRESGYYRGVVHSFLGTWPQAQELLSMGLYLSYNGIVTFKNAKEVQAVARRVPLNRILLETDSPYLAPHPYRGKRNAPVYVEYVARKIAELKGISLDEVSEVTTANARALFGI